MSPRRIQVPAERILDAACAIVREEGLGALTARHLAQRLGSSVMPIYRAWESMERLVAAVLQRGRDLLGTYLRHPHTAMAFGNVGVGMVLFARDEPHWYRALFLDRPGAREILDGVLQEAEGALLARESFRNLPPQRRRECLQELWTYTHGLAMQCVAGLVEDPSSEALLRRMDAVGYVLLTAALGGNDAWDAEPDALPSEDPFPR